MKNEISIHVHTCALTGVEKLKTTNKRKILSHGI